MLRTVAIIYFDLVVCVIYCGSMYDILYQATLFYFGALAFIGKYIYTRHSIVAHFAIVIQWYKNTVPP